MDHDIRNLITQLCTQAGMIMEDVSIVALTVERDDDAIRGRLKELRRAAKQIDALIQAASLLE